MEKVYKIGITRIPKATYKIYQTCIIIQFEPSKVQEVIKWLPVKGISDQDFNQYYYFIDEDGDLSRRKIQ